MDTNGVSMNYCELNELSILLYIMQYLKFWVIKNQTAPSPHPKFVFYPLLVCSDALVATGYIISVLQKTLLQYSELMLCFCFCIQILLFFYWRSLR